MVPHLDSSIPYTSLTKEKKKKNFVETWVLSRPADTLLAHTTTLHFFLTFLLLVELVAKSIRYWIVGHPLPSNYGAGVKVATGFDPEVPDGMSNVGGYTCMDRN